MAIDETRPYDHEPLSRHAKYIRETRENVVATVAEAEAILVEARAVLDNIEERLLGVMPSQPAATAGNFSVFDVEGFLIDAGQTVTQVADVSAGIARTAHETAWNHERLHLHPNFLTLFEIGMNEHGDPLWRGGLWPGSTGTLMLFDYHIFADETERDNYFVANPDELVDDRLVLVDDQFQLWQEATTTWYNISSVIRGARGVSSFEEDINGDLMPVE